MVRTREEMIIVGLGNRPITDLAPGWAFTFNEVAPYVFKAEVTDLEGRIISGAGGNADEALENYLKRVKRKFFIRNISEEIIRIIRILLGLEK